ncbi:MAG: GNAT family N-acetyltransferase [Inquilinus sp.]|nr:GNAT family N-acetyltransferase [Inquilinus sp.]
MVSTTFEAGEFWRSVLARAFALRERAIAFAGAEIVLWKHPLHGRWVSTPYRDRLAIRWSGDAPVLDLDLLARAMPGPFLLKDVGPYLGIAPAAENRALRQQHTNADVLLDENIRERLDRSARKNLRKAGEEYGLVVDTDPVGCFEDFWNCYLATRRRLGVAPYEKRFFGLLFDGLGGPVRLFRCRRDAHTLGYLLCYVHSDEMISAHIAYDYESRRMRTADFLFLNAFFWGAANGFRTYRFGGDYNNQTSLLAAKRKLGAVTRQQYDFEEPVAALDVDDPNALVRRALRLTPMPLFRHAGLLTRLYFR